MPFSFLEEAALNYWEQIGGPVASMLRSNALRGNWRPALTVKVSPGDYTDPKAYLQAHAAAAFVKKNPFIAGETAASRKAAALATWRQAEIQCFRTNSRLSYLLKDLHHEGPFIADFLSLVRHNVRRFVGEYISDAEMHRYARFGPGTTSDSSVKAPTPADKYNEVLSLTRGSIWYLASWIGTTWSNHYSATFGSRFLFSRGNRFTTVPKTAVTDRSIAIECSLNVYFQLAVGTVLRKRLKESVGLDLDRAAQHHRQMARLGSLNGDLATLDLSSASDTVSSNLVRLIMGPSPLAERLWDLRSPYTFVDKRWVLLEKFSSMGNGYTFELETVIFLAIAWSVMEQRGYTPVIGENISVFGDDIIVPTRVAPDVMAALRFCGFLINPDKSFLCGPFRESCGGDFFTGVDVRGYFHKSDLQRDTEAVYSLHNGARRTFEKLGIHTPWFLDWVRDRLLSDTFRSIGGSERFGDQALHGVQPRYKWQHQIRSVRVVQWSNPTVVPWRLYPDAVRLACALTGYGSDRGISARGKTVSGRRVWVSDS